MGGQRKIRVGELFAGLGGIAYGIESTGHFESAWFAEIDPYCQEILRMHWPGVQIYGDVRQVDWDKVEPVELLTAGFPCQPSSTAGRRKGTADERWLWPEVSRAIGVLRPRIVLLENVPGLLSVNSGAAFGEVVGSLARLGYDLEWSIVAAAEVGAPHLRKRVFLAAWRRLSADSEHTRSSRSRGGNESEGEEHCPVHVSGEATSASYEKSAGRESRLLPGKEGGMGLGLESSADAVADSKSVGRSVRHPDDHRKAAGEGAVSRDSPQVPTSLAPGREDGRRDGGCVAEKTPEGEGCRSASRPSGQTPRPDSDGERDDERREPDGGDGEALRQEQGRKPSGVDGEADVADSDFGGLGAFVGSSDRGEEADGGSRATFRHARPVVFMRPPEQSEFWRLWHERPIAEIAASLCRVDDGLPARLHSAHRRHRLQALGNAVVPQVSAHVGQLIWEAMEAGRI